MSAVPVETIAQAAKAMLATIRSEWAKNEVQRIANGHASDDPCGLVENGRALTYREREDSLSQAEGRLREEYDSLLD